jgi:hypothetical protein
MGDRKNQVGRGSVAGRIPPASATPTTTSATTLPISPMRKDTLQAPPQLRSRSPLDNRPLDDYTDPDEYDPTYLQYATLSNTTASFPSARRPDKEASRTALYSSSPNDHTFVASYSAPAQNYSHVQVPIPVVGSSRGIIHSHQPPQSSTRYTPSPVSTPSPVPVALSNAGGLHPPPLGRGGPPVHVALNNSTTPTAANPNVSSSGRQGLTSSGGRMPLALLANRMNGVVPQMMSAPTTMRVAPNVPPHHLAALQNTQTQPQLQPTQMVYSPSGELISILSHKGGSDVVSSTYTPHANHKISTLETGMANLTLQQNAMNANVSPRSEYIYNEQDFPTLSATTTTTPTAASVASYKESISAPVVINQHEAALPIPGTLRTTGNLSVVPTYEPVTSSAHSASTPPLASATSLKSSASYWTTQQPPSSGPPSSSETFGLLGLLKVLKMTDPDLNTLALGIDLTTLGLSLSSPEYGERHPPSFFCLHSAYSDSACSRFSFND